MPLFKRCKCEDEGCKCGLIRRHKLIRRTAALGGILVGIYFLGAAQGLWDRFLF